MDLQKKDKTLQYCLREGTILDHYMLKQVIEIGGYGIVYRALDLRLHKEVAIKEFFPAFLVNRSLEKGSLVSLKSDMSGVVRGMEYEMELEQFLQEARWMAGLADIVEVVRVTDLFEGNNTAYLVMDYLRGKNLKQMLIEHKGRIPSAILLPSMESLVKALGKIHARGLLHRDLSPDNIMVLEDGSIRLIDFGNASNMHDKTFARIALKHGFAAPELYGEEEQGTYTDVYGLCATMYICIGLIFLHFKDRKSNKSSSAPVKKKTTPPILLEYIVGLVAYGMLRYFLDTIVEDAENPMIKIIVVVSAVIGILRYFICKKENRIYLLETSASLFWGAAKYCGCCLGIGILSAVVYVKFIPAEDDNIENIIINCWCLLFVVALILIIFIFALMIIRTIYFLLNKLWPTGATQSVHTMQPTGATQSTQATPSAWREQTVVTVADMLTSDNGNTSQSKQEGTIPLFFEEETDTRKETETVDENQASSSYRGLRWQICGLAGDYAGESFLIDGTLQIGRNPNAQVAYSPNSKRISKLHCQLLEDDGRIYIRDENSTNGTFLGKGIRLEPEVNYCLEEDDVFYLAEVEQRFCLKKG